MLGLKLKPVIKRGPWPFPHGHPLIHCLRKIIDVMYISLIFGITYDVTTRKYFFASLALCQGRTSNMVTSSVMIVTSYWAWWRLKPPASRLFTQPFVQVQIKENIKAPRHWPFVKVIHRWPVNSPHKWPVMWKMFSFDVVTCFWGRT